MDPQNPKTLPLSNADTVALRIRGYTVGVAIGEGGNATIYRGRRHDRPCAIKHLIIDRKKSGEVLREIFMLTKLAKHPNIVTMYDLYLIKRPKAVKELLIFMELMPGGDLFAFYYKQSHVEPKTVDLFKQTADAVAFMHSKGYAHLDLKEGNVLLDAGRNIAKVADFGTAILAYDEETGAPVEGTEWKGTLTHSAPEVLARFAEPKKTVDASIPTYDPLKGDVWSMGIILYVMLHAGVVPFPIMTLSHLKGAKLMSALVDLIQRTKLKFDRDVRPAARELVSAMLQLDPTRRPTMEVVAANPWLNPPQIIINAASLSRK